MAEFPPQLWFTLPETLKWLDERKISKPDAQLNLPRVFRNSQIQTRGRSKGYTGHDTQTKLNGIAWDQATVNWESSSFAIPDKYGKNILITDVEVSLKELFRWIENSENQQLNPNAKSDAASPLRKKGPSFKYDWDSFYVEVAVKADLDNLPDRQGKLEKEMAEWCDNNWKETPTESMLRSKLSPIYNHPRRQQGQ